MTVTVTERSFEDAIRCGLLQHGPDACPGDATAFRETPEVFGESPPGDYRKRRPEEYDRALGPLLLGVADDGSVVGIERDRLESDDKFMRHLTQVVRNGLGDRAGTCIDPRTQIVGGKTACVVSCQRSPEPVFLKWKGIETDADGDFYVRSGPGTVRLAPESATEYIRTRFPASERRRG